MEENFEELLKQSEEKSVRTVKTGQKIEGHVVVISKGSAFVDIGMRTEAVMPLDGEDERHNNLSEGDTIPVFVTKPSGQIEVGMDPIIGFGDMDLLREAFESGTSVTGKVYGLMSGGYEVNVVGVRCFCPRSQLGLRPIAEPQAMVGQEFPFRVIDFEERSKNVVLSHRVLLEEERQALVAETRKKVIPGAVLTGKVADIQSFGAFIDFGGLQGLLHISQLAYQKVDRVEDVLTVGEEVEVKILDVTQTDSGKERISLSRKAVLPDPWEALGFAAGSRIEGVVVRKSKFGIFINLASGIDGLLPLRMLKKAGRSLDMESFEDGQKIEVDVVDIDFKDHKMTLALPGWDEEIKSSLKEGDMLQVEVVKVLPVGLIVQGVDDPARGLVHKRHLKHNSMKQLLQDYPVNARLEVVLQNIDDQGRFNFGIKNESEEVDREVMARFADDGSDLGHNPFAAFFGNKK